MRRIAGNTIRAALLGAVLFAMAPVATTYADATSMDWTSVAQKVLPSVVNVEIETLHDKNGVAERGRAVGTGFIIDPSGFIVTNKHVVNGAFRITVTLADRSQWDAQLVVAGQVLDVAVLKINGHERRFGVGVHLGAEVVAIFEFLGGLG